MNQSGVDTITPNTAAMLKGLENLTSSPEVQGLGEETQNLMEDPEKFNKHVKSLEGAISSVKAKLSENSNDVETAIRTCIQNIQNSQVNGSQDDIISQHTGLIIQIQTHVDDLKDKLRNMNLGLTEDDITILASEPGYILQMKLGIQTGGGKNKDPHHHHQHHHQHHHHHHQHHHQQPQQEEEQPQQEEEQPQQEEEQPQQEEEQQPHLYGDDNPGWKTYLTLGAVWAGVGAGCFFLAAPPHGPIALGCYCALSACFAVKLCKPDTYLGGNNDYPLYLSKEEIMKKAQEYAVKEHPDHVNKVLNMADVVKRIITANKFVGILKQRVKARSAPTGGKRSTNKSKKRGSKKRGSKKRSSKKSARRKSKLNRR